MRWERECHEYARLTGEEPLSGDVRVTLVVEACPDPLRQHLQLNAMTYYKDYERLRSCIVAYLQTRRHWLHRDRDDGGPRPMEIGLTWQNRPRTDGSWTVQDWRNRSSGSDFKGKGKGKGKEGGGKGSKDKGKGKSTKGEGKDTSKLHAKGDQKGLKSSGRGLEMKAARYEQPSAQNPTWQC